MCVCVGRGGVWERGGCGGVEDGGRCVCVRAVNNILHECVMWSTRSSRCQKTGMTAG